MVGSSKHDHWLGRVGVLLLILLSARTAPANAATITLQAGCDLIAAIDSANGDTSIGTCTNGSEADTIVLTSDVELDTVDNTDYHLGDNALPIIMSDITIDGRGQTIRRIAGDLRIFQIAASGSLTLRHVTVEDGEFAYRFD